MPRDDFTESVKRTLAMRAAFMCSNPDCRRVTVQPHSDPDRALRTGEACHIHGASPGGPRYDPTQTPEERRSINNGIWLCAVCAVIIDKDEAKYPPHLLRKWKSDHEAWIANNGIVPELPEISIATSAGLPLPAGVGASISGSTHAHLRHHTFTVASPNHTAIAQLEARITLPEPVVHYEVVKCPAGVEVVFRPYYSSVQVIARGGGTATRLRGQSPTGQVDLAIERLPAQGVVKIQFFTSNGDDARRYIEFVARPLLGAEPDEDKRYLRYYIDGRFQYEYGGITLAREVFAPIVYDATRRALAVVEVLDDHGNWQPLKFEGVF